MGINRRNYLKTLGVAMGTLTGGKVLAANASIPLLGEIPIDMRMRKGGDVGEPMMVEFPDSELAIQFKEIAARLATQVEVSATAT